MNSSSDFMIKGTVYVNDGGGGRELEHVAEADGTDCRAGWQMNRSAAAEMISGSRIAGATRSCSEGDGWSSGGQKTLRPRERRRLLESTRKQHSD